MSRLYRALKEWSAKQSEQSECTLISDQIYDSTDLILTYLYSLKFDRTKGHLIDLDLLKRTQTHPTENSVVEEA